jgi:hypothetical protein
MTSNEQLREIVELGCTDEIVFAFKMKKGHG